MSLIALNRSLMYALKSLKFDHLNSISEDSQNNGFLMSLTSILEGNLFPYPVPFLILVNHDNKKRSFGRKCGWKRTIIRSVLQKYWASLLLWCKKQSWFSHFWQFRGCKTIGRSKTTIENTKLYTFFWTSVRNCSTHLADYHYINTCQMNLV